MRSLLVLASSLFAVAASADEGMWTLDNLPLEQLEESYDFRPSESWKERIQKASLRIGGGGSASFVSSQGLIMTNHHVGLGTLHKLSNADRDLVKTGFLAATIADELKCPGLEALQLASYENVTETVHAALQADTDSEKAAAALKAITARLTKASEEATGLHSEMVSLYQGGEYWIYRYKKFTDIRLVMAPEAAAGFFGGDSDNFTYPRFALDFAFFRAYENDKPATPDHWFRWSKQGAAEDELVFVSGHPGHTERQKTVAELELERDLFLPTGLKRLEQRITELMGYSERGPEQKRQAHRLIFGMQNGFKAMTGKLEGLRDPDIFGLKIKEEKNLRRMVRQQTGGPFANEQGWKDIEQVCAMQAERWEKENVISRGVGHSLFGWAMQTVNYGAEIDKPNEERYSEFADTNLDRFTHRMFATQPAFPELEAFLIELDLIQLMETLGGTHPLMETLATLGKPDALAARVSHDTRFGDPEFRRKLIEGGPEAIQASEDPMLQLARVFSKYQRPLRQWQEDHISIVRKRAGARIAEARFQLLGRNTYPDATFTLRLSHGRPAGYTLNTTEIPFKTVFGGLYARSDSFDNQEPFQLSPKTEAARAEVNQTAAINLVTTNDITGGNSGSPLFNRELEIVGLIFDGNLQSLSNQFVYSEKAARAVSVHSAGIIEALRSIYRADHVADELEAN